MPHGTVIIGGGMYFYSCVEEWNVFSQVVDDVDIFHEYLGEIPQVHICSAHVNRNYFSLSKKAYDRMRLLATPHGLTLAKMWYINYCDRKKT